MVSRGADWDAKRVNPDGVEPHLVNRLAREWMGVRPHNMGIDPENVYPSGIAPPGEDLMTPFRSFLAVCVGMLLFCCATETHRAVTPTRTGVAGTSYSGERYTLVVGKFHNRSTYLRGIFSDGVDRLGSQSKTILKTHLQETNRFVLVDRANMDEIAQEAKIRDDDLALKGAQVVLTGDVTEFGRKTTGDVTLFGILGAGKTQVAYAKVALNVVDVRTSEIIYSATGAGEYALSSRQVLGTGGAAGYDATLNGKVLDLAVREAVERLVEGLEMGRWHPTSAGR
jgi:curli biogenesis system outer membrane secretion channel CsgG